MSEHLEDAKEFLHQGKLEYAGLAIGKALESVLKRLIDEHNLSCKSKTKTIKEYIDELRKAEIITKTLKARINFCKDIRNIGAHDNPAEKITEVDIKFGIETVESMVRQFFPLDIANDASQGNATKTAVTIKFTSNIEKAIKGLMEENQIPEQPITPELLNSLSGYIKADSHSSAISLLKQSVLEYVKNNPGSRNVDVASGLNISSHDKNGGHKDWFSHKLLQILVEEGIVKKSDSKKYYVSYIEKAIKGLMEENQIPEQPITPELLNSLSGYIKADSHSSAISLLKQSVLEYVKNNPGSGNVDVASGLNISSHDKNGGHKDWFFHKLLQILVEEGVVKKSDSKKYYVADIEKAIKGLMEENQVVEQPIPPPELLNSLLGYIKADSHSSAISLLKQSVLEYVKNNPGSHNVDVASGLNISSHDKNGGHKDWFSDKLLQILVEEGVVKKTDREAYYAL